MTSVAVVVVAGGGGAWCLGAEQLLLGMFMGCSAISRKVHELTVKTLRTL